MSNLNAGVQQSRTPVVGENLMHSVKLFLLYQNIPTIIKNLQIAKLCGFCVDHDILSLSFLLSQTKKILLTVTAGEFCILAKAELILYKISVSLQFE